MDCDCGNTVCVSTEFFCHVRQDPYDLAKITIPRVELSGSQLAWFSAGSKPSWLSVHNEALRSSRASMLTTSQSPGSEGPPNQQR
jgi:hypothetical protein